MGHESNCAGLTVATRIRNRQSGATKNNRDRELSEANRSSQRSSTQVQKGFHPPKCFSPGRTGAACSLTTLRISPVRTNWSVLAPSKVVDASRTDMAPCYPPKDVVKQCSEKGILLDGDEVRDAAVGKVDLIDDISAMEKVGVRSQVVRETSSPAPSLDSPCNTELESCPASLKPKQSLTETIANKLLKKYFATELEKVDSPLEIWMVINRCLEDLAALVGKTPNLRQKHEPVEAFDSTPASFLVPGSRDSGIVLEPTESPDLNSLKDSSNGNTRHDDGEDSDREEESKSVQYINHRPDVTNAASGGKSGTQSTRSAPINMPSSNPQRKRRPRRDEGDENNSQDEGGSDGNGDGEKDPSNTDNFKTKRKKVNEPDMNLSCPFRKRNRLRFNIRDHYPCASQAYPSMALLKRHVRTFHKRQSNVHVCLRCQTGFPTAEAVVQHLNVPASDICQSQPVQTGKNPEDGITPQIEDSLIERKNLSKVDNWDGLWQKLFPGDTEIPQPGFEPPVELDEVYAHFQDVLPELDRRLQQAARETLVQQDIYSRSQLPSRFSFLLHTLIEETFSSCRKVNGGISAAGVSTEYSGSTYQQSIGAQACDLLRDREAQNLLTSIPPSISLSISPSLTRASAWLTGIFSPSSYDTNIQEGRPTMPAAQNQNLCPPSPPRVTSQVSQQPRGFVQPSHALQRTVWSGSMQHTGNEADLVQRDSAIDLSNLDMATGNLESSPEMWCNRPLECSCKRCQLESECRGEFAGENVGNPESDFLFDIV